MPLYTYECKKCHELIKDYYQLIAKKDLVRCPACGGKLVKIISKCNFALKGDRWAKDGYSDKLPPQTNK